MGESVDLFEDLRERNNEKGHGSSVEPVEPAEPAAPSAPPAHDHVDLEAPLLGDPSQRYGSNQAIEGQIPPLPPPVLEPLPPEGDPLLYVCRILSIVTAVGALLCLLVNAISLFRSFDYRGFDYRVSVCPPVSFLRDSIFFLNIRPILMPLLKTLNLQSRSWPTII